MIMNGITVETECPASSYETRPEVTYPEVVHETYFSTTTGLERGANVILPPHYDTAKKYPVLYLLHGIFGDEYVHLRDGDRKLLELLGNLTADGLAKEMVVVLPHMYATSDPNQQPAFNPEAVKPYDNFINDLVTNLMPFIAGKYSVYTDREHQAIAGFSMGGRESMFIGMTRPDLVAYCTAFAPAPGLTPGRDFGGDHQGQLQEDELVVKDMDNMLKILMVDCGTNDSVVGKFPLSYHKIMTTNQVNHIWYEVPGADHASKTIQSGYYNFLRYVFK